MAIRCENCIHNGICYLQEVTNDINKQLDEFGCEDYKSATDVEEVKHERWVACKNNSGYKCSNCGARIKNSDFFNGNHIRCHKCGAKMDGKPKKEVRINDNRKAKSID